MFCIIIWICARRAGIGKNFSWKRSNHYVQGYSLDSIEHFRGKIVGSFCSTRNIILYAVVYNNILPLVGREEIASDLNPATATNGLTPKSIGVVKPGLFGI